MMHPHILFTLDALRPWMVQNDYHPRDWGLVTAALERPWAAFNGVEIYPDVWTKTAAMINSITVGCPLVDGNRSLSVLLGLLMIHVHGYDHIRVSDRDWFCLINDVARTRPDADTLAARIKALYTTSEVVNPVKGERA